MEDYFKHDLLRIAFLGTVPYLQKATYKVKNANKTSKVVRGEEDKEINSAIDTLARCALLINESLKRNNG